MLCAEYFFVMLVCSYCLIHVINKGIILGRNTKWEVGEDFIYIGVASVFCDCNFIIRAMYSG